LQKYIFLQKERFIFPSKLRMIFKRRISCFDVFYEKKYYTFDALEN